MSNVKARPKKASQTARRDPLASLRMADLMISKPVLPAEITATIVDYLDIPTLLRFARVSRRMQEMVYDDARWIQRLKRMGCWNETEARQHLEAARAAEQHAPAPGIRRQSTMDRTLLNSRGRSEILVNIDSSPAPKRKPSYPAGTQRQPHVPDGFDPVQISNSVSRPAVEDELVSALSVFTRVRSIRGQARQEYGKLYAAVGKFYSNAILTPDPMDAIVFKTYAAPEQQAQMLSQIRMLSDSDFSPGDGARQRRLQEMIERFSTAALLEFRKGYEYKDIQGRMRKYAHVMYTLDGGRNGVEMFLHDNNLVVQKANLGNASDCIDYSLGHGQLSLERVQAYFERLGYAFDQESAIVKAAFPNADEVQMLLLEMVGQEVLSPFLTSLFEDARTRGTPTYLRIISGSFAATRQFITALGLPKDASDDCTARANAVMARVYEPHLDIYLAEELASFKHKADAEIDQWDRALSEQAASTESFLMSNINRQADKKDFMSSFKKVVMMPVNILPSFSNPPSNKTTTKAHLNAESEHPSRTTTPNPFSHGRSATPSLPLEAPTTELAAKAAVMNSNLDNIRSLFSIEVALSLVHSAKSSLERIAQFITLGGLTGESARARCSAIFHLLVQTVGVRHVKAGFDKAIDHLSTYNPREASLNTADGSTSQVAPLATFLELVNVGDLIQQMLDVFYESELVRLRVSNRDDFLDPSVKEKKKFEAMLDERVAAGLGKGIDVLMDEVEYICATSQLPGDFNPEGNFVVDIGPTNTAKRVIEVVGSHTNMLTGATDKTLLDVFTGEVGLRLFTALCKHIKRQRVSTAGSLPLLSDLTAYASYVAGFRNQDLNSYFTALREVAQIYLIEGKSDKDVSEMATIISDGERYRGVFTVEEVVEFAERRSDWLLVRTRVEGKVRGESCVVM